MPTEDVSMGDPFLFESVAQGTGNVLLAGDIGEALGTVFAGENLISHSRNEDRDRRRPDKAKPSVPSARPLGSDCSRTHDHLSADSPAHCPPERVQHLL